MAVKKQKFYQANPNLPDGELEFEFTAEMRDQLLKCREDVFYFAENFFHIVNLDRGKEKIQLYPAQRKVLRTLCKSKRVALLASRQIGKSTITTIYALWLACFQSDKRIIMLANKEKTAIQLFSRIRLAYEMLPNWLKPGVKDTFGKSEMKLVNGSSIACSSTSASSVRGDSANCVDGSTIVTVRDKRDSLPYDITMEMLSELLKENGELPIYIDDDIILDEH